MTGDIEIGYLLLWSVLATAVLTAIMGMSQGFGWSRISLPYMIGTLVSKHRSGAMIGGMALHFIVGVVFAFAYIGIFVSINIGTWWFGGLLGFIHGAFVLSVAMPLFPSLHPQMAGKHHGPTPTRRLEPPGFFGLNYGNVTPFITLAAHILYGIILGAAYGLMAA